MKTVDDIIDALRDGVNRAGAKMILEVDRRIRDRTPVKTGRAKGNWRLGLNGPDTTVDMNDFDPTGTIGKAKSRDTMKSFKAGDEVHITNGLPYIRRLENGWSDQAPEGMLAVTAAEIPALQVGMAGEIRQAFEEAKAGLDAVL